MNFLEGSFEVVNGNIVDGVLEKGGRIPEFSSEKGVFPGEMNGLNDTINIAANGRRAYLPIILMVSELGIRMVTSDERSEVRVGGSGWIDGVGTPRNRAMGSSGWIGT